MSTEAYKKGSKTGRRVVKRIEVKLVSDWLQMVHDLRPSDRHTNGLRHIKPDIVRDWSMKFQRHEEVWPRPTDVVYGRRVDTYGDPGCIKGLQVCLVLGSPVPSLDHGRHCYYAEVTSALEWDKSRLNRKAAIKEIEVHTSFLTLPAKRDDELGEEDWQRQYTTEQWGSKESDASSTYSRSIVAPFTYTRDEASDFHYNVQYISPSETITDISKPSTTFTNTGGGNSVQSADG